MTTYFMQTIDFYKQKIDAMKSEFSSMFDDHRTFNKVARSDGKQWKEFETEGRDKNLIIDLNK